MPEEVLMIRQKPDLPSMDAVAMLAGASWRSGMVSGGPLVSQFEKMLAEYCGYKHCICVSSGTVALMLAIRVALLDETIDMPSFTWMSTAHAARWADRNILIEDVTAENWTMEYDVRGSSVPVWPFGIRPALPAGAIVGDCCQALGADIKGCDVACLSFSYSKVLTTGEGGACLTHDNETAYRIASLRNNGKIVLDGGGVDCKSPGFTGRMTEFQGAMGVAGMESLELNLKRRRAIALRYMRGLSSFPAVLGFCPQADKVNWGYFPIRVEKRGKFISGMRERGVEVRPYFDQPIHKLACYDTGKSLPVTEILSREVCVLPIYAGMPDEEVSEVIRIATEVLSEKA